MATKIAEPAQSTVEHYFEPPEELAAILRTGREWKARNPIGAQRLAALVEGMHLKSEAEQMVIAREVEAVFASTGQVKNEV